MKLGQAIPKHVRIPSIKVDADVDGLGLTPSNGFELTPLDVRPQDVGWYLYGPPPGSAGTAVLLSHVNFNHVPGAFSHLSQMKAGDKITVTRSDGTTLTFTTTRVASVLKAKFDSVDTYAPTPDAELVMITCGGTYDAAHKNYLSNTIVRASLDKP